MHNLAPRICALAVLSLAPLFWHGLAAAADYHLGALQITEPWARATPEGVSSGAAYMTVMNAGPKAERLNCVSSDAATKCEIHEMSMDGGVMRMRPVEGGLEIKPGETVTLKPGGFHMMLTGLKAPLRQGKTLEVTLQVDNGGTAKVEFPIAAVGAPEPGGTAGGHMMMQGSSMAPMSH